MGPCIDSLHLALHVGVAVGPCIDFHVLCVGEVVVLCTNFLHFALPAGEAAGPCISRYLCQLVEIWGEHHT